MNTPNEIPANSVRLMNLTDVIGWMLDEKKKHPILECFTICVSEHSHSLVGSAWVNKKFISENGSSLDELAEKIKAHTPNPDSLRAEARRLENEAALLELEALNAKSFTVNTATQNV